MVKRNFKFKFTLKQKKKFYRLMKTKKKILIISPSLGFGGAERFLINISNFLSKNFDVEQF